MALFKAPLNAGYRLLIRPYHVTRWHPSTGEALEWHDAIWADFGQGGQQTTFVNPETGETMETAAIHGHYYDTEVEAAEHGWDSDTHDLVIRRLRDAARREPYRVQEISREKPAAPAPWPSYDQADAAQAVSLAVQLGLVAEALAYEQENRQRPAVTEALQEALNGPDTPPDGEDEPDLGDEPLAAEAVVEKAKAMLGKGSRTIEV